VTAALGLYNKDPERDTSKVWDFLDFCVEHALPGSWPPFPVTIEKLTRFLFFIQRDHNISNGWKGVLTWRRAIVRWMAPVQFDPFTTVGTALEERVRNGFTNSVEQRRFPKVPVTTALFNAVWDLLSDGSPLHEMERTLYLLYHIGGFRAATFTKSSDKRADARLVRIMHVSFFDAADGQRAAFLILPMTKTTSCWQPVGHCLRGNPTGDVSKCAVHRLEALIAERKAKGAQPTDPIFVNPRTGGAYSRNTFAAHLKVYVDAVASRYVLGRRLPKPPSAYVSGISFRRGVISRLAHAHAPPQQIAVYSDHRDINSQMHYICETYEAPGVTAGMLYAGI
jgi:hypothetical protein